MNPSLVGERLQQARRELGLTLDQLGEQSGVSRAMLSKIERGSASPTLALVSRVMEPLGLTLTDLSDGGSATRERIIHEGHAPEIEDEITGVKRETLAPMVSGYGLEVLRFTIPPRRKTGLFRAQRRGVFAVIHVLQGRIRVHEGVRTHEIAEGDTGVFRGDLAVGCENIGAGVARFISIVDYHLPFQVLNLPSGDGEGHHAWDARGHAAPAE